MSTDVATLDERRLAVFERADELADAWHDQIVFCRDRATGLKAIIAIHDTTLGPGLGGTRFYPYVHEADALTDVLRLSQGMTAKAAAADLPLGGAKAVIIGDPRVDKTPALLEVYGRFVEALGGRYYTAADVGTTSADLDVIGRTTSYVVGRTTAAGGTGDSGYSTALGVFTAMRAAGAGTWGSGALSNRRVGVEGIGKVGRHLVRLLLEDGAQVRVSDVDTRATDLLAADLRAAERAAVEVVPRVIDEDLDVYAPCALGATLTPESVPQVRAQVICGAANNQLSERGVATLLDRRGIRWVPDFIANAGGVIQVGSELRGSAPDDVRRLMEGIGRTTDTVLTSAEKDGTTTLEAAERVVEARLAGVR